MTNEILPVQSADTADHHSPSMRGCRPVQGDGYSRHLEDIAQFDRFRLLTPVLKLNLIGDNHHMANFFPPENGHKYLSQSNPTTDSVFPILENIKGASLLWLRGCDKLLGNYLSSTLDDDESIFSRHFPFEKFKTLTILEISGVNNLITVPKEISEMTQLQSLNLSHLAIQNFPAQDYFSKLTNLSSLVLKGCSNLQSLPRVSTLTALEFLDLSFLLIGELPEEFFSDLSKLRWLSLKGCSKLQSIPSTAHLKKLEMLDLSHCITLQNFHIFDHPNLVMLDLSYTDLHCTSTDQFRTRFIHVFCRDSNRSVFESLTCLQHRVQLLDLSGTQNLRRTIEFEEIKYLEALNLSRTSIECLNFLSPMYYLCILSLRECGSLVKLPEINNMKALEMLDISRCGSLCDLPEDLCELKELKELNLSGCTSLRELRDGVFDQMTCLEKLDLSETNFSYLPSFANLDDLGTHLILSRNLLEKVQDLSNLKNLSLEILQVAYGESEVGGRDSINISNKASEFHLVSTFTSTDSPFYRFKHKFTQVKDLILEIQRNLGATDVDFGRMFADLEYIQARIDLLESFDDHKGNCKKLLGDLMYAVEHIEPDDFTLNSTKLKKLFRLVAKLKLLVPYRLKQESEEKDTKDPRLTWQHEEEAKDEYGYRIKADVYRSFESLTEPERKCLLYFAATPRRIRRLEIEERNLIHLWYGEEFIFNLQGGRQILEVLQKNRFIETCPSRYWSMDVMKHTFVRQQAREECFFDFDHHQIENWIGPHLIGSSQRACLLKSRSNMMSSSQLWLNYTRCGIKKDKYFKNIRTLLNVNDPVINIRSEWFSKMTNLAVLHLGRWDYDNENIEVVDLNFLEDLKNMKQLRLLNFERVSAISKLPDSISNLTNLKILNLRHCSDLEELPTSIGSLTNLVHLDVTHCPLLSILPKGIKLLSELEVLKGFLIMYEVDGRQNKKACTLADLNNLEKLRKLNIVVNKDKFPNTQDLQAIKKMKNLCNLKITWLKSNYVNQEASDDVVFEGKALKNSRWKNLKCWDMQTCQNEEIKEPIMTSNDALVNLKKLVLCCFPSETAPKWLHPGELQNLEKLYVLGGHLQALPGEPNQNTWNVKALHLVHTLKLKIDWESLRLIFPNIKLLKKIPEGHLSTFPVDDTYGLWTAKEDDV